MPAGLTPGVVRFSQRAIYDERYRSGAYDARSAVRVLRSEREAMLAAVRRAARQAGQPSGRLSVLDFGYGTGRVVNEFLLEHPALRASPSGPPLTADVRLVGYDVSAVGLRKAADQLRRNGFETVEAAPPLDGVPHGYVAERLRRETDGSRLEVVLVHGHEDEPPAGVHGLLLAANDGAPYDVTTSWYSGLGHIPGRAARAAMLECLVRATADAGELLLAVASTGDMVDARGEWAARLAAGDVGTWPVHDPGDLLYETELGQLNFWHVFDTDLVEDLEALVPGRQVVVRALRMPGAEFACADDEALNHAAAVAHDAAVGARRWRPEDFARCHTVAVVVSPDPRA